MAEQHKQYAEGKSGELYGYTGKTPPAGTTALVEEDGSTLTAAGLKYCQRRGYPSPMVATLRTLHDQYHAPAVGEAIVAAALNADLTGQSVQSQCRREKINVPRLDTSLSNRKQHIHKEHPHGKKPGLKKRNQKETSQNHERKTRRQKSEKITRPTTRFSYPLLARGHPFASCLNLIQLIPVV
jgi:hypothetical protein